MIAAKGRGPRLCDVTTSRFSTTERQADDVGELFRSAEVAVQYGARVARDIASDPEYHRGAGTVVIAVDASDAEVGRHRVEGRGEAVEVRAVAHSQVDSHQRRRH